MRTNKCQNVEDEKTQNCQFRIEPLGQYAWGLALAWNHTRVTFEVSHLNDGRPVVLVDTPGFDDTYKSEILTMIADWLVKTSVYCIDWFVLIPIASYIRASPS